MRVGVIGIVVEDNEKALEVQSILTQYAHIIKGRMGLPDKEHRINIISLIVEAENEHISALTGKLGKIDKVTVKSALTKTEI